VATIVAQYKDGYKTARARLCAETSTRKSRKEDQGPDEIAEVERHVRPVAALERMREAPCLCSVRIERKTFHTNAAHLIRKLKAPGDLGRRQSVPFE